MTLAPAPTALEVVPPRRPPSPTVHYLENGMAEMIYTDLSPKDAALLVGMVREIDLNRRRTLVTPVPVPDVPGTVGVLDTEPAAMPQGARFVSDTDVPAKHRAYVRRHIDAAAAQLGLGHVNVRFFLPCAMDEADFLMLSGGPTVATAGMTPDTSLDEVRIQASLRGPIVAAACAHEMRHLWQNHVRARLNDPLVRERDAERFSASYLAAESHR